MTISTKHRSGALRVSPDVIERDRQFNNPFRLGDRVLLYRWAKGKPPLAGEIVNGYVSHTPRGRVSRPVHSYIVLLDDPKPMNGCRALVQTDDQLCREDPAFLREGYFYRLTLNSGLCLEGRYKGPLFLDTEASRWKFTVSSWRVRDPGALEEDPQVVQIPNGYLVEMTDLAKIHGPIIPAVKVKK